MPSLSHLGGWDTALHTVWDLPRRIPTQGAMGSSTRPMFGSTSLWRSSHSTNLSTFDFYFEFTDRDPSRRGSGLQAHQKPPQEEIQPQHPGSFCFMPSTSSSGDRGDTQVHPVWNLPRRISTQDSMDSSTRPVP